MREKLVGKYTAHITKRKNLEQLEATLNLSLLTTLGQKNHIVLFYSFAAQMG